MFSLQQNQIQEGRIGSAQKRGEVAQTLYAHVNKCKNDLKSTYMFNLVCLEATSSHITDKTQNFSFTSEVSSYPYRLPLSDMSIINVIPRTLFSIR
jgi:cytochrome c oxidase assembly protein Cox11